MKMLILGASVTLLSAPAAIAGTGQSRMPMQHPEQSGPPADRGATAQVQTAEQMRTRSAWGMLGGMSDDYRGVGGPDESEEQRAYPPCRGRGDDRCRQGR